MPIDSLFIQGLCDELDDNIRGARIDKIYMPRRDQIVMNLRSDKTAQRLVVSVGQYAAVWLTKEKYEYPDVPPMFCMLLRKQLSSGRIVSVSQPCHERIIEIKLTASDEMGDISEKKLICEFIGRQKNVIVVNADGIITACLRNVSPEADKRAILPGMAYVFPKRSEKPLLFEMARGSIEEICGKMPALDKEKYLCGEIGGITLSLAREAVASGDAVNWLYRVSTDRPAPYLIFDSDGKLCDVSAVKSCRPCSPANGFSAALDDFYGEKSRSDNLRSMKANLQREFSNAKKRTEKRLAEQKTELIAARGRDALKEKADLIMANIGTIKSGKRTVRVTDYFDPDLTERVIELDDTVSPQQNAQKLYKKYARLKNAEKHLSEQIVRGEEELNYINSLLFSLEIAEKTSEIDSVKLEAKTAGIIKNDHKKEKNVVSSPRKYATKNGFELLCGRNNTENDYLTHRMASKKDIWFHARGVAGSHVVLVCCDGREAGNEDIEEAAGLAAFFCADKNDRITVDYTLVKNVRKPSGGRPGEVNYFDYKSVFVKPALPSGEKRKESR